MNDEKRDPSSPPADPLDDWLAAARWPEPTRMSTERLRQRWRELNRQQPRHQWHARDVLIAVAAGVVIAFGVWMSMTKRATQSRPQISTSPPSLNPFEQPAVAATLPPFPA